MPSDRVTPAVAQATASAEQVAEILADEFLRLGYFNASTGPTGSSASHGLIAVSANQFEFNPMRRIVGEFAGLQVQSVGFEEGTEHPAVHLYLSRASARIMRSLPDEVLGVPLKAHKMGPVNVRPEMAASSTNRGHVYEHNGFVCCGSSCAPTSENCAGTLGALVRRVGNDQIYLLSNNHVFAGCNHVPQNQPILSPSNMDGRPDIRAPEEIGRHEMISPLASGDPDFVTPCEVDLALARATKPDSISSWQGDDQQGYDTPVAVKEPESMMAVKKFGRTTDITFGVVESKVTARTPIPYTSKHFKGVVWFQNIWAIRSTSNDPFALGGDSGSLVVTEDGTYAVGILFAASQTGEYGWIVPMPAVVAVFGGLELVGGHGV